MKTPDPTPALLPPAHLAEIRERARLLHSEGAAWHAVDDRRALLAHLDALTPRAVVDGEALGRVVWEERRITFSILNPGIPLSAIQSWEGLLKDAKDERTERAKVDECIRIGLALHAIGYAAGVVAMTGESDDPGTEGAVFILMKRHDAELHAAHAAGRSEGEAERVRLSALLAAEYESAGVAIEGLESEVARLTEECDAERVAVLGRDATIARLTTELAEARAAIASAANGSIDDIEAARRFGYHERDAEVAAARLDGAREERRLCLFDVRRAMGGEDAGANDALAEAERAILGRGDPGLARATEGRKGS